MKKTESSESYTPAILIAILLIAMVTLQLFVSFRGLADPVAMDQAQIARQFARGEGMTTKLLRPMAITETSKKAQTDAQKATAKLIKEARSQNLPTDNIEEIPSQFNVLKMRDTNNAPLNIFVNAVALKVMGATNYDAWVLQEGYHVYGPDRIIAGVSTIFFILSILAIYFLVKRIFDNGVAGITCVLLILSDVFLRFSISGLPQMLMLFLFTMGMHFLYSAIQRQEDKRNPLLFICLASLFFAFACLAGWLAIWPFVGFIIFVGVYFRPHGAYALPPIVIFFLVAGLSLYNNYNGTGSVFGTAIYSIYEGIAGGESSVMRVIEQREVAVDPKGILTLVASSIITQLSSLYSNMGGVIVTLFFFLAIFHPFKNKATNALKWAAFSIWILTSIGMALYSNSGENAENIVQIYHNHEVSSSQIQILLAPLFIAFGLALLFVFLARTTSVHGEIKGLRPFIVTVIILVSSGKLLIGLPDTIRMGLLFENTGRPQWPELPYLPTVMTNKLHRVTEPDKIVATDLPWAVAWYSDRYALWLPRKYDTFVILEEQFAKNDTSVSGILITPFSHSSTGGIKAAYAKYGDFAALIVEGPMIELLKPFEKYLTSGQSKNDDNPIIARFAHANSRVMLAGANIIYYSQAPVDTLPE